MKKKLNVTLGVILVVAVLLGLTFFGRTVYLICKTNYRPVSVADFFLIGSKKTKDCFEMIDQDYAFYELTPTVTIRTSKIRYQGKEVLLDYVGEKTALGIRYRCPFGGTNGIVIQAVDNSLISKDETYPHELPVSGVFIYAFDDCTVLQVFSPFDFSDNNGKPLYIHENDTNCICYGDTCRYFIAPTIDELPKSYCLTSNEDTITYVQLKDACD